MRIIKLFFIFTFILIVFSRPLFMEAADSELTAELINFLEIRLSGIEKEISAVSDNNLKLAELYLQKSEIVYHFLQLNKAADYRTLNKKIYMDALNLSRQYYEAADYQPGVFLCKSRALKFEIIGIEEITDIRKYYEELSEKFNIKTAKQKIPVEKPVHHLHIDLYSDTQIIKEDRISIEMFEDTDKTPEDADLDIEEIIADSTEAETDTIIISVSDTSVAEPLDTFVKPDTFVFMDTAGYVDKAVGADEITGGIDQYAPRLQLAKPAYFYSDESPVSPVLRQILFTEKLEKEYEIEQTKGLLGFRDREFGRTKLTISGQKTIDFIYTGRKYSKPNETVKNTGDFKIEQSLEVKVRGKVGDNVDVNIDYDDKRSSSNRQQLSIEYKSDDYILNKSKNKNILSGYAAFGDIVLSLPATEFVSYRRSLFGIKGGIKLRNIEYSLFKADQFTVDIIASRTKGEPGFKEFIGASSTQIITNVYDINYVKNKYFKIVTGIGIDTDIQRGTLSVYIDDKIATNNQGNIDTTAVIVNPVNPNQMTRTTSETFSFTPLQEIRDYVYDMNDQILTLNNYIGEDYAIAVSYKTKAGYEVKFKLIKRDKETQFSDTYIIYSIRNRYSFGISNINKDDPELMIRIQDKLNNFASDTVAGYDTVSFLTIFGLDRTGPGPDGILGTADDRPDGKVDDEYIDYENGVIKFPDAHPFNATLYPLYNRPEIYNQENPTSRFRFYLEVKAQLQQYFLNAFDLVRNSETVKVDGKTLTRNVDYYIDYETGMLIFLEQSLITKNSKITVEYEKVPFGASANKTLFGARLESIINSNFRIGTTFIKNQNDKPNEMPTIDATPQSTSVRDVDMEIKPVNLFVNLINNVFRTNISEVPSRWFDIKLITEVARSEFDPNIYGSAMIDDMESSKDSIDVNLSYLSWNNTHIAEPSRLPLRYKGFLKFEETNLGDNIGHKSELDKEEENQKSLWLQYNLNNSDTDAPDTWFAARTLISKDGVDITKKKYLELWINNADSFYLTIDLGQINEDMDGDGMLDQEDGLFVDGIPTSVNTLDGRLNKTPNEDVGILYNTGYDTVIIGAGNGRLDSEDLNGNGRLDQFESFYRYQNINIEGFADDTGVGKIINGVPYRFYRINLDRFTEAINNASKTNIKHIRLLFVQKENTNVNLTGNIYIDYISLVGSIWEDADITDTYFIVGSKNNIDDNYMRFEPELQMRQIESNESNRAAKEQALYFAYSDLTDSNYTAANYKYYAKREFGRSIDLSKYRNLIFYVKSEDNNDAGETVFIRLGDENNYFEYKFRAPDVLEGWKKIEIPLDDFKKKIQELIADTVPPYEISFGDNYEYKIKATASRPSFYNIRIIKMGVIGDQQNPVSGDLLINTLYVSGALKETGLARKTQWQTRFYKDIFMFNMRDDYRENTFRSIDEISSSVNQSFIPEKNTTRSYDGSVALGRLMPEKWRISMPVSGSYSKSTVDVEPDAAQEVERSRIGMTETTNQTFSTSFSKDKLPMLKMDYSKNETDKDMLESKFNILSERFNSSASYSLNFQKTIFGEMIGFKKIPLLNKIPAGKEFAVNLNYQYNYTIDDKNYMIGAEQSAYDKYTTYYKKIGVVSRPFKWIRLQPDFGFTDKYHITKVYSGLENQIMQSSINIDINRFLGFKPFFDFSKTEDIKYDISKPDSDPIENYDYSAGIRLDVFPADWSKLLKFIDSRFNVNGKYTEILNTDQIIKNKNSSINGNFIIDVSLRPKDIWKHLKFITMNYSYNNSVSAAYTKIDNNYDFNDIFNDYFSDYFFPWADKQRAIIDDSNSLQVNRASSTNSQSHSFNGQFYLWEPLSLRYNYNLKNGFTQTLASENYNNSMNAQLNSRLDLIKGIKLFRGTKKSSLNLDYRYSRDETGDFRDAITETLTHDRTLGIEIVWTENFNTAFSMNSPTTEKNMQTEFGSSVEKSVGYSPRIVWNYYTSNPFKLFKPFTKKQWLFENKLNLNGSFSFNLQKSELLRIDNTVQNITNLMEYGCSFGAQYDMSDFLRMSADSRINIHKNKLDENNDYIEYSINTKVIIIF